VARDAGEMRRIEVGFTGGQVILMRLADKEYEKMGRALQDAKRWTEVETADGVVSLDLGQVVFVKLESADHKVGFSGL
jgi:hypothetical protein